MKHPLAITFALIVFGGAAWAQGGGGGGSSGGSGGAGSTGGAAGSSGPAATGTGSPGSLSDPTRGTKTTHRRAPVSTQRLEAAHRAKPWVSGPVRRRRASAQAAAVAAA